MKKQLLFLFVLSFFINSFSKAQNVILWGVTYLGGAASNGTLFEINGSGSYFKSCHAFGNKPDAQRSYGPLYKAPNGLLYGLSYYGGIYNSSGSIFDYVIPEGEENPLYSFGNGNDGKAPEGGGLIQVGDSLMYGLTSQGGVNYGDGIMFSYNIFTGVETVLHNFGTGSTDGVVPQFCTLVQATNNLLYGNTVGGGTNSDGTIFSYDISTGVETTVYNFGDAVNDAQEPTCTFVQIGDSLLYGVTPKGGTNGYGTIFTFNIYTHKEKVIYSFTGYPNGEGPDNEITLVNDSLLYGLASEGTLFHGIIYKYNINTGIETDVHDFGNYANDGYGPVGYLLPASNGLLYGETTGGGANGDGTIFTYNVSTDTEMVIHSFSGDDGDEPEGGLIEDEDTTATTGIEQLTVDNGQLTVYPNPTSGQFTIQTNGKLNGYTVEIYDVMGEEVYSDLIFGSKSNINLSNKTDGLYFVYIKSDSGVEVQKIILTNN